MMDTENQTEKINRHEFLRKLGLSGASLMAVYCGVTMSSCKNEEAAPATTTTTTTAKTATYNIDTVKNGDLKNKGGFFVDATNNIVIANTSDNGYVAVTLICTHAQNKNIIYSTNRFLCTVHGATFDNTGKNLTVAPTPLTAYKVTQSGNILTVTL
jgi:cytochrome b6-f complex iron-sulfur subunit